MPFLTTHPNKNSFPLGNYGAQHRGIYSPLSPTQADKPHRPVAPGAIDLFALTAIAHISGRLMRLGFAPHAGETSGISQGTLPIPLLAAPAASALIARNSRLRGYRADAVMATCKFSVVAGLGHTANCGYQCPS